MGYMGASEGPGVGDGGLRGYYGGFGGGFPWLVMGGGDLEGSGGPMVMGWGFHGGAWRGIMGDLGAMWELSWGCLWGGLWLWGIWGSLCCLWGTWGCLWGSVSGYGVSCLFRGYTEGGRGAFGGILGGVVVGDVRVSDCLWGIWGVFIGDFGVPCLVMGAVH